MFVFFSPFFTIFLIFLLVLPNCTRSPSKNIECFFSINLKAEDFKSSNKKIQEIKQECAILEEEFSVLERIFGKTYGISSYFIEGGIIVRREESKPPEQIINAIEPYVKNILSRSFFSQILSKTKTEELTQKITFNIEKKAKVMFSSETGSTDEAL